LASYFKWPRGLLCEGHWPFTLLFERGAQVCAPCSIYIYMYFTLFNLFIYFLSFKSLFYLVTFLFTYYFLLSYFLFHLDYFFSIFFGPKNILFHFKVTKLTLINYLLNFRILITKNVLTLQMLVFVLAALCWTKSLLCNVAAFTEMLLYPESTL